nr:AMP-binding protein [Lachnospiraceae bacterium]
MGRYLERVFEVIQSEADRPFFVDGDQSITYGEVGQESGKIYRYLRSKGIGKEDFVQIIVKKDIHFYSCMLGVWRAGAAFVINEAGYPKERLEFIGKDLHAKLVLDQPLFETIMVEQEPLSGYEETDPHDACYAVYTSGSTGNPKGVLHEYGNLDQSMESFFPMAQEYLHYRNGFVPPLNFVASILESVVSTACAMTNFMVSGEMLRDYNALTKFIAEERIDRIYLPPSYIRIYKKPAECLKVVQTGSEPANGLYYEGGIPEIVNTYSMSEAGFCVLRTTLDRAYDVAPVGFPGLAGIKYELIDDDGKVVEGAGQGELCFANEYVRGYINLPEQTSKAFVDGMYHTADICRRDETGAYFVVGRNDDMIKINGNRIEPAEIEAA